MHGHDDGRDRDDRPDIAKNLGHKGQPAPRERHGALALGGFDPAGLAHIDQAGRGPPRQLLT